NLLAFQREVKVQRMSRAFDTTTSDNLQIQFIAASAVHAGTSFGYGSGFVTLASIDITGATGTQATSLEGKLHLLGGAAAGTTVTYDSARVAYRIQFSTTASQAILYDAGAGQQQAAALQSTSASLTLPLDIAGATFS